MSMREPWNLVIISLCVIAFIRLWIVELRWTSERHVERPPRETHQLEPLYVRLDSLIPRSLILLFVGGVGPILVADNARIQLLLLILCTLPMVAVVAYMFILECIRTPERDKRWKFIAENRDRMLREHAEYEAAKPYLDRMSGDKRH